MTLPAQRFPVAVELGPHNVRTNCVALGVIKTDFSRAPWEDPGVLARASGHIPLQRFGEPDDGASAVNG
jgi:NAD(P)-dependent dehydrogenase (short-subunit alcohol dehydrogenase family)